MLKSKKNHRFRAFLKDSVWSVIALIIMNIVLQLILYPVLRRILGVEVYGDVLFIMGVVNVVSTSIGCSANNSRLKMSVGQSISPRIYENILIWAYIIYIPLAFAVLYINENDIKMKSMVLLWMMICLTTYRNYADVEFRLSLNYKGFFLYYLFISIGYLIGLGFTYFLHNWMIAFLTGEITAIVYVKYERHGLTYKSTFCKAEMQCVKQSIFFLVGAQLLVNIVLNADRIILKILINSTAVTIYYAASLIGKTMALITVPLNSVIIGYLVKKKECITKHTFCKIIEILLFFSLVCLMITIVGSHIFVYLFYPNEYKFAKDYFVLANIAQVFYFVTGILNTILLRYMTEKFQVIVNGLYCIIFFVSIIPATLYNGLAGFSYTLCFVNIFRFILVAVLGIKYLDKSERVS